MADFGTVARLWSWSPPLWLCCQWSACRWSGGTWGLMPCHMLLVWVLFWWSSTHFQQESLALIVLFSRLCLATLNAVVAPDLETLLHAASYWCRKIQAVYPYIHTVYTFIHKSSSILWEAASTNNNHNNNLCSVKMILKLSRSHLWTDFLLFGFYWVSFLLWKKSDYYVAESSGSLDSSDLCLHIPFLSWL